MGSSSSLPTVGVNKYKNPTFMDQKTLTVNHSTVCMQKIAKVAHRYEVNNLSLYSNMLTLGVNLRAEVCILNKP